MKKFMITSAAMALMLGGGTAFGAATWSFSDWDADGNLELTEREFTEGLQQAGVYGDWDADASGDVGQDEFYGGVFASWDEDDDGQVTENEFMRAGDGWFEDGEYRDFGIWDTSGDGVIDQNEFGTVSAEAGLYDTWNANAGEGIGEDELYSGLYETADYNDDQAVSEDEDGWFDWF